MTEVIFNYQFNVFNYVNVFSVVKEPIEYVCQSLLLFGTSDLRIALLIVLALDVGWFGLYVLYVLYGQSNIGMGSAVWQTYQSTNQ